MKIRIIRSLITGFLSLSCIISASAQTTLFKFQKVFGRSQTDLAYSLKNITGGGYLLAGSTQTVIDMASMTTRQEMYIIKTDSAGNITWAKTYGSVGKINAAFSIEEGVNGYYVFGNTIDSVTNISKSSLLHIDTAGNVLWNKTYSMYSNEWGAIIKKINANAYILCGKTLTTTEDFEVFMLKIDSSGNVLWGKGYNGDAGMTDVAHALSITPDGGFLITGDSYFIPSHDYYVLAIKTDSAGTPQWIKAYADTRNSRGVGGYKLNDGYILGGQMIGTGTAADMMLIRTDDTGNIIWAKTYGGGDGDFAHALTVLDSGYALFGESSSFYSTTGITNSYVVKTDTAGNLISSVTYGDSNFYSAAVYAINTPYNGLAFTGISTGYGPGLEDFYLVKTLGDTSGCYQTIVSTTISPVAITANSFLNADTLSGTVVTDISGSIYTTVSGTGSGDRSDSILCSSTTVVPDTAHPTLKNNYATLAAGESKIYPNPAKTYFTVETEQAFGVISSVRIFNSLGMDVSRNFTYTQSGNNVSFKSVTLAPGIYWIHAVSNEGRSVNTRVQIE